MLKKLLHLQVKSQGTGKKECLPVSLIVRAPQVEWFQRNESAILQELCEVVQTNYKQIEANSLSQDYNELPPQLFGTSVRIAYVARPRTDSGCYTFSGSSSELADSFEAIESSNMVIDPLWVFPHDENDPDRHKPLAL